MKRTLPPVSGNARNVRRSVKGARRPWGQAFRLKLEQLETRVVPSVLDYTAGFTNHSNLTANGSARILPEGAVGQFLNHQDIGFGNDPGTVGNATFNSGTGTYTLTASGSDVWDTADKMHYVYEPLNGNGEISARMASETNTDFWTKGGVMIRDGLTPGARNAFSLETPSPDHEEPGFQWRTDPNGGTSDLGNHMNHVQATPVWLRVVRSGNSFTAYWAHDLGGGQHGAWNQMGTPQTINMASTAYVGLGLCAHNNSLVATATFDNVTVIGDTSGAPQPEVLRTTSGGGGEAGSIFTNTKVDLTSFYTTFNFQFRPGGNPIADGMTFTIQNNNPNALGGAGGGLGYQGIDHSAAVKFDAWTETSNHSSTGLYFNGVATNSNPPPPNVFVDLAGTPINFNGNAQVNPPHTYQVELSYSGTTLVETIRDLNLTGNNSVTHTYTGVNLATLIGSSQGYVGFTGGTGGATSIQEIQSWYGQFLNYTPALTAVQLTAPSTTAVGLPTAVTVKAVDQNGNLYNTYARTVHFSSTDPQAQLPADYTFSPATDHGQHTFTVTLNSSASRSVTATDNGTPPLSGTATLNVSAALAIDHSAGFASNSDLQANGSATFLSNPVGVFQNHRDIGTAGNPSTAGSASYNSTAQSYTLMASGSDIGFSTPDVDHFHYVYSQGTLANTSTLMVRIASLTNTDFWTKAVLQVRGSLDPAAPNVQVVMSPHNQTEITWRDTQGGGTGAIEFQPNPGSGPIPGWIKLDRNGTTFTASWAPDNNGTPGTFTVGGSHTSPNIGNNNVYVGLGLTAHNNSAVATGVFDHLSLTGFTANAAPSPFAELTDGGGGEAGGVFTKGVFGARLFSTSFQFQFKGGNPLADGLTFVIQNDPRGPTALGDAGGSLGYGHENPNDGNFPAIHNSIAIKFDAWKPNGNHSSTGLYVNGHRPNNPPDLLPGDQFRDLAGTPIDFTAGGSANPPHTFQVNLSYDGSVLSETIKDLTTNGTYSTTYNVDLRAYLGAAEVGYVGFTGGTGGVTSTQDIKSWTGQFLQTASLSVSAPTSVSAGAPFNVTVSSNDQQGNPYAGYRGTVHLTSTDAQATLPADHTFTAADNGSFTFTGMKLRTSPGPQTITARDTVTSSITGTSGPISVTPGAATFTVTGYPNPATAGTQGSITVTAKDGSNNTVTGYRGTVHFSSSDPQAGLPMDYTFTATDNGVHTFTGVVLKTAGTQSITVTDAAGATGSQSGIVVNPAAASALTLAGFPSPTTAGDQHTFTVTAKDPYGNTATGYRGTVHFSSTDPHPAMLPADYMFTATDNGVHTFNATLYTAGTQSITATDTANNFTATQPNIVVNPAATSALVMSALPTQVTAGMQLSVTVTAKDAYNNTTSAYRGTVHFSSTDPQAVLPTPDYTFTATDAGTHTFSVTLKTAGTQSVTVRDNGASNLTDTKSTTVNPAATSVLAVTGFPSPTTAGDQHTFTVTAKDAYGNTTPAYTGTVHFSSTDPYPASLPGDYMFTATDNGVHTFNATLYTAGTQSITATDTANNVTGAQAGIVVTPAAASTLTTDFPPTVTAGTVHTFHVKAFDPYNNVATGYTGTVHFSSSDPEAFLPGDYMFTAADGGVHTFAAALRTAGMQTITVTDAANNLTVTQTIQVNPAGFQVSGFPSPVTAGTGGTFTVTAVDAQGNPNLGYTGTVHFSSTDPQAQLPDDYTFTPDDQGTHTFSATLFTAGTQSITVTDSAANVVGSQDGIEVTPAAFSTIHVAGFPSPTTAGVAGNFSVTAQDDFGNTIMDYAGTVHFASTDPQAQLPDDYSFTPDDHGSHSFVAVLKTAGTQSISATDQATGITGSQDGIVVNPAGAVTLQVTGFPNPTTAGSSGSVTVTVQDVYGNTVTGYTGTVHFSSSDPQAVFPAQDYTFTAADAGTHTFTGVVLKTAGTQSITVTDMVNQLNGIQSGIVVNPAAADHFMVAGFPSPIAAGNAGTFTVTVQDLYGNTVTGYTGTVHFSSDDMTAYLPGDYTFTADDAGVHTFGAVFNTPGTYYLRATDVDTGVTGAQTGIVVTAPPPGPQVVFPGQGTAPAAAGATATSSSGGAASSGTSPAPASTTATAATPTLAAAGSPLALDSYFTALAADPLGNHGLDDPISSRPI